MPMLWQIRLKALIKYKIINTEIDYDFHASNCVLIVRFLFTI